jgi:hypothetical protein
LLEYNNNNNNNNNNNSNNKRSDENINVYVFSFSFVKDWVVPGFILLVLIIIIVIIIIIIIIPLELTHIVYVKAFIFVFAGLRLLYIVAKKISRIHFSFGSKCAGNEVSNITSSATSAIAILATSVAEH